MYAAFEVVLFRRTEAFTDCAARYLAIEPRVIFVRIAPI
jgi:hypothetical protein